MTIDPFLQPQQIDTNTRDDDQPKAVAGVAL